MERITVYYNGIPIVHHRLSRESLSIGSHPTNDLVLAGTQVAERHLVVFRGSNGRWLARSPDERAAPRWTEIDGGARLALGPFSVAVEPMETSTHPTIEVAGTEDNRLGMVGNSPAMKLLRREIVGVGTLRAPVLVVGETGTGKELVARNLHKASPRSSGPFVPVNCGGLTESMLEDTLFGHERGSFTGARGARRGVFEQANGGTLFLDEIGELPIQQQAALLRVLDDNRVSRIGSEEARHVDFRLVTATNRSLQELIAKGEFRLDLYHRIAALEINTTPLRERPGDIGVLARHFLKLIHDEVGERDLGTDALDKLMAYGWPGNARELKNALYRAAIRTRRRVLDARHFELRGAENSPPKKHALDRISDAEIETLLDTHKGNVAAAARELGVPRTSLRDRAYRMCGS